MKELIMNRSRHILIFSTIVGSIIIIAAVCWHSVEEIHYLKSFFPAKFTVEEAFYASAIELIKVVIIGIPVLLVIGILLFLMRKNPEA